MGSIGWALTHHDWRPCKKRILGYRGSHGDLSPPCPVASGGTQSSHCLRSSSACLLLLSLPSLQGARLLLEPSSSSS